MTEKANNLSEIHRFLPVFGNELDEQLFNIILHYQEREDSLCRAEEKLSEKKRRLESSCEIRSRLPKTFLTILGEIGNQEKELDLREKEIRAESEDYKQRKKDGELRLLSLLEREKICLLKERISNLVEDKIEEGSKAVNNISTRDQPVSNNSHQNEAKLFILREKWLEKREKELMQQEANIKKSLFELGTNVDALELKEKALKDEKEKIQKFRTLILEKEVDLNILEQGFRETKEILSREKKINEEIIKVQDKELIFKKQYEKYRNLIALLKGLENPSLEQKPAPARFDNEEILNEGVLSKIDMNSLGDKNLRNKKSLVRADCVVKNANIVAEKQNALYTNLVLTDKALDEKLKLGIENQFKALDKKPPNSVEQGQISLEKENLFVFCCGKN